MKKGHQTASEREKQKADALALAELIYDMFKEEEQRESDKIEEGQNNAQPDETN